MADFDSHAQTESELNILKLRNKKQYYGAFIVNLGAFSLGTVIGWSSPAEQLIVQRANATDFDIPWISSIMTLGAASSQIVMALLLRFLSCKQLLISMNAGLALAWMILLCSTHVSVFYVGRFFTGFFAGTNCVTVPIFIGEVSHKSIRGTMGILFQLMIVFGILTTYALGEFHNFFIIVIVPIIFPASLIIPMLFIPESPIYSIKQGNMERARKSLRYFRGPTYEIEGELAEIVAYTSSTNDETFLQVMKERSSLNALLILVALHFVQQLSGINAFMFYAKQIFENSGSSVTPGISAIIMALVQFIVTGVAAILVDKVGRRLLMVASLTILAASNLVLGTYMLISTLKPEMIEDIQFLPVVILSVYIIGFSLGAGPLPWVLLGEMVPNSIKFIINTGINSCFGVACFNWILAFLVTVSFKPLQNALGSYTVFYIYGGVCVLGVIFVFFFLVETKNKTLEEVQVALSKKKSNNM